MTSKADIISLAFTKLGRAPITDADLISGPPEVKAASKEYDLLKDTALAAHPWRFSTLTADLPRLVAAPPVEYYQYAFMLPSDFIQLEQVRPFDKYRIYENLIYSNNDAIQIDYRSNLGELGELKFPSWFTLYMIYHLAANIAMMVTQNAQIASLWETAASNQLLIARYQDSQQQPNDSVVNDQITGAHYGTGIRGAAR